MTDPALVWVTRLALALLFGWAVRHKLVEFGRFEATLADYRMLPAWSSSAAAGALVIVELALVVTLLLPVVPAPVAGLAAIVVLLLYTVAIGWNLARGRRHIDCGCLGPAGRRPLSEGLVLRNLALAGCAAGLLVPTTGRLLTWVDAVSIVGGTLVCALIWAAVLGLLEARPPRAFEGSA